MNRSLIHSVWGMNGGADFLDRSIIELLDELRNECPIVPNCSRGFTVVMQPSGLNRHLPGLRQLLGTREPKYLHELGIPKPHCTLIPGCIFGVGDVDDQANSVMPNRLCRAALEQQSRQPMCMECRSLWVLHFCDLHCFAAFSRASSHSSAAFVSLADANCSDSTIAASCSPSDPHCDGGRFGGER
jgi:hypothetical protein